MQVEKKLEISESHLIEYGRSSWSSECMSVRNRYNHESGKFDRVSSQEIPIQDIEHIISFLAENKVLGREATVNCLKALVSSLS